MTLGELQRGDATAIIEPGRGRVSYAELDRRAAAVAVRLAALGVAPGARVGLYARRSADAVAAILGVLRAGCAYVPVDPAAPPARNVAILADCGAELTLADAALAPADLPIVALDDLRAWPAAPAPAVDAAPDALACILYTSGSTGRPKGWMMTRAAIAAHARWCHDLLAPGPGDVFANHAQLSFGMSLFDVFGSLGCGAALCLVPDEIRAHAGHVLDLLGRERVSIWFSAPGILALMAASESLEARDLGALRVVAFAGEVFPAPPLRRLRQRLPGPRYFNFWGSTETNVGLWHELSPGDTLDDGPPPIGRPCAHYQARVVAPDGASAPAGSPGELQLRGVGLSTGYIGQPELSAERLLPAGDGGGPWYRTADLAIELPGGELRYAGRLGRMVKLRGYRVEPGEIEARLSEHPSVREAGVVPFEGSRGLELVAHLSGARLSTVELKEFCAVKLPPYMIPARFVFHEALPRNARGKLDLERLRLETT